MTQATTFSVRDLFDEMITDENFIHANVLYIECATEICKAYRDHLAAQPDCPTCHDTRFVPGEYGDARCPECNLPEGRCLG